MDKETYSFRNTRIAQAILALHKVYEEIEEAEGAWMSACPVHCIDGCGMCCVHFEPDLYEVEALYLAAWMLCHQRERALQIMEGNFNENVLDKDRGCLLFDIDNRYHCTVYGGRALICRLFGYSGDRGKDLKIRWRPCKYLTSGNAENSFVKKNYDEASLIAGFGTTPPVMSDFTLRILGIMPESLSQTSPMRKALPAAIAKILMLEKYSLFCEFEPDMDPETPPTQPLAS